ncbi:MAG: His-Xaa-Ser system protein HxsD [Lachnospiraceae bacterium]|nr:His-Xaa-Ser system protein HxsD [Lachnospiraceae bacterium]
MRIRYLFIRDEAIMKYQFKKDMYPRIALLKAAYNYTDRAYLHLDTDETYYYVDIELKNNCDDISEKEFKNEILVQSLRHEVYLETKNIRELLMARALATTVVTDQEEPQDNTLDVDEFCEEDIIKDWFTLNED